jgi:hypothetical protein
MANYEYARMSDKEFEVLATDVISVSENKRVERFKPGKDSGIDGRFYTVSSGEVIIQCKHWERTGLIALIKHLNGKELKKIQKLNPLRYILITTVELSRANKKRIFEDLSPYIKTESDIWGREDLDDFISRHAEIETRNYKLWLASSNVLSLVLFNGILGRSKSKIEETLESSRKYVYTKNHERSFEKINKTHTIIITGEAGIGKTTLADQLMLYFSNKGFQLVFIIKGIEEAENVYQEGKKQIFYFDDFLGRSFLVALEKNEDTKIVQFIKRVERDNDKRFLLTSRTTILIQGKSLSDVFYIENLVQNEYEIKMQSLGTIDKAKLLYNHIWFSDLSKEYIDEIYKNRRYLAIIKHKNFNPRLISFITDAFKIRNIESANYWEYIEKSLDYPKDIWSNIIENQLDENSRLMVTLIVMNGKEIDDAELIFAFMQIGRISSKYGYRIETCSYEKSIEKVVGSVINRTIDSSTKKVKYDLFNPSVADYILDKYKNTPLLPMYFEVLMTGKCIDNCNSLYNANYFSIERYIEILICVILSDIENVFINEVKMKAAKYLFRTQKKNEEIIKIMDIICSIDLLQLQRSAYLDVLEVLNWMLKNRKDLRYMDDILIFIDVILDERLKNEEIIEISHILSKILEDEEHPIKDKLIIKTIEYWKSNIDDMLAQSGTLDDYYEVEDVCRAKEKAMEFLEYKTSDYVFYLDEDIKQSIIDGCDVESIINNNREAKENEESQYESVYENEQSGPSEVDIIIDLFDRQTD